MRCPSSNAQCVCWILAAWLAGAVLRSSAQNYSINSHVVAAGGGTSTNAQFTVSGTIGQPESGGTMTNGSFSLVGGFWPVFAVQTEGNPRLYIVPDATGFALISWAQKDPPFVLQETHDLASSNWVNSASGTNNQVIVPTTTARKFYRLHRQH